MAVCLSGAYLSYLLAQPAQAECCKCNLKNDTQKIVCVQILGNDCANALSSVGADTTVTCTNDIVPAGQCKTKADGGICDTLTNVGMISSDTGATATSKAPPREPFKATIPTLNINIPGLEFASGIGEEGGFVTLPFISQYISAFYRFAAGAALIAAALMVIYGGFLYLLGSSLKSVTNGKEKIKDALIGMVLVLTSYLLLTIVNPDAAQPQPLTVKIAKYDEDFINSMSGDASEYTPSEEEIQSRQQAAAAIEKLFGGKTSGSQTESSGSATPPSSEPQPGAQTSQTPAPTPQTQTQAQAPTTAPSAASAPGSVELGDITLPYDPYKTEDGWAIDEDGKKLWPEGCSGFKMVGKGNEPGSFVTVSNAFRGKPRSLEGLKAALQEAKRASQIGTFYARGIENLKPYPFIAAPTEAEIQDSKQWSSYVYNKIPKSIKDKKPGAQVHVEWIVRQMLVSKKWITSKVSKNCGDMSSLASQGRGTYMQKFYQRFSKDPESRRKLEPCINSIIEVYNNTYYKVAKCFNIFTNQCSFETYFQTNFGKSPNPTEKDVSKEDAIANFKSGKYQPGSGVFNAGNGHQWLYTGGLGLGYEVMEFGGQGGAPPVIIEPGLFGETQTKFERGLSTQPSMAAYLQSNRAPFSIAAVQW
jgi:hypothetical protein